METRIVQTCIEYLDKFIGEPGIFRKQGDETAIANCLHHLHQGNLAKILECDDPHVATCVLKRFFRELPQPVLTRSLYVEFMSCMEAAEELRLERVKDLVGRLPELNRNMLGLLVPFLGRVAQHASENFMTAENLGVVFGPSLIWSSSIEEAVRDMYRVPLLVQLLVENVGTIWPHNPMMTDGQRLSGAPAAAADTDELGPRPATEQQEAGAAVEPHRQREEAAAQAKRKQARAAELRRQREETDAAAAVDEARNRCRDLNRDMCVETCAGTCLWRRVCVETCGQRQKTCVEVRIGMACTTYT